MEDITNSPGPSTRKRAKPKTVITKKSNLVDSTITNLCVASQSHLKTKLELKRMEIAASLASKEEQEAKQETINLQLRWVAKLQQVEAGLPADMKPRFYETVFDSVHEKSRAVDLRVKEHELALKKVELDLKEAEEHISKLTMASKKDTAEEANKAAKSLYDSLMEAGK
ncbi:hypothetical protein FS749_000451 [Ceratobasidium sp. UAMH 11750]|nr:hypothetical protein FS749_000451 [Ceratobasidium sp. UAMH 11750]